MVKLVYTCTPSAVYILLCMTASHGVVIVEEVGSGLSPVMGRGIQELGACEVVGDP